MTRGSSYCSYWISDKSMLNEETSSADEKNQVIMIKYIYYIYMNCCQQIIDQRRRSSFSWRHIVGNTAWRVLSKRWWKIPSKNNCSRVWSNYRLCIAALKYVVVRRIFELHNWCNNWYFSLTIDITYISFLTNCRLILFSK